MNDVFFACAGCRQMVDAGYRWATSRLEQPGLVARGAPVAADEVLASGQYWAPSGEDGRWLRERVLPRVHDFLEAHRTHGLVFGDAEEIMGVDDGAFLDWLDVSADPQVGPRYLTEVLELRLWVDVLAWLRSQAHPPWWFHDEETRDAVRRRFDALAAGIETPGTAASSATSEKRG